MNKKLLIIGVLAIVLLSTLVSAANLYVNASHGSCDDNRSRASNTASAPWCGQNTTWLYAPISGDTVNVYAGTYREPNGNGFVISNKDYGPLGVNFYFSSQANFTAAYANPESGVGVTWVNYRNLTDGSRLWNSSNAVSTSTTVISGVYKNNWVPMFNAPTALNVTDAWMPNFTYHWNSTSPADNVILKLPYNVDPRQGNFSFAKAAVFTLTNLDNARFFGGNCMAQIYCISTTSGVDNFTWYNVKVYGGVNDNGVMRFTGSTNVHLENGSYLRADAEAYGWFWQLVKESSTTQSETSAIKFQDCDNCNATKNNISGYFNGIVGVGSASGDMLNWRVEQNTIDWIMDDAIEPEGYLESTKIINNTIKKNVYVGFSASPANSSTGFSNLSFNVFANNRTEATYNNTGSTTDATNQKLYNNAGFVGWYRHNNAFLYQDGLSCNGERNNQINVTDYNNFYHRDSGNILDCTGLQTSGTSYDYNLYYTGSGYLARYVNSTSVSTSYSTIATLKNAMLAWNVHSISVLTTFDATTFQPNNTQQICSSGLGGSYIGPFYCSPNPVVQAPSSAQLLASNPLWLYFNWTVNNNTNHDRTTVLVNSVEVANKTATQTTYNATGLVYGTNYLITLRNYDIYGNSNESNTTLTTDNLIWTNRTGVGENLTNYNPAYLTVYPQGIRKGHNLGNTSTQAVGQTFTLSGIGNTTLDSITVVIDSLTTGTNTLRMTLYNTSGDTPIGTNPPFPINFSEINNIATSLNVTKNFTFTFTNTILQLGTKYAFILTSSDTTFNYRAWTQGDSGDTYPDHLMGWEEELSTTYTELSVPDLTFEINYSLSTEPGIEFTLATPSNNSNLLAGTTYTISADSDVLGTWAITNISLYNSSGSILNTIQVNSTLVNLSFNLNTSGVYYFNATAYDNAGFSLSETRQVNIYSASLAILSPLNLTTTNNTLNITWRLNTTQTSLNITSLNISINNLLINTITGNTTHNYNWTNIYNWNLTIGINNITINATLTDGNQATASATINITRNTLINLSARNSLTNAVLTTFDGWIYQHETGDNQTFNSTTGLSGINETRGNLTIYLTATDYSTSASINTTTSSTPSLNVTFLLYPLTIPSTYAPVVSQTCALNTSMFFNIMEETNLTKMNATINYNLYFLINSSYNATHVYGTINTTQNFTICTNTTLFPEWQVNDGEIEYYSPGYVTRRYYIFNNSRLSNTTTNITLYELTDAEQTSFKLAIESNSLAAYNNHFTTLVRWYPGLNAYNVVDMGKTDNKGETVIHVVTEDVDYRIGVYERNGTLVYLANPIRMVCLTTPCTYTLKIPINGVDYTDYLGIQTSLTYNTTTGIWTLVFNDPSQTTTIMNLTVYKETGLTSYQVCNNQVAGYTGAINCNTSAYTGRLHAYARRSASPERTLTELIIETITSTWNSGWGLFLTVLIVIPTIMVFAYISPIAGLIGGVISLIPAWYLGSINFAILAAIAVLGGIVWHFAKRVTR